MKEKKESENDKNRNNNIFMEKNKNIKEEDVFDDIKENKIIDNLKNQHTWTILEITITPENENTDVNLEKKDIINSEYIVNKEVQQVKENNNTNNNTNAFLLENGKAENIIKEMQEYTETGNINNENENIIKNEDESNNIKNENENNLNEINNKDNNKEKGNNKTYYVLVKNITHKKGLGVSLFSSLDETAEDQNFTYSISIVSANTTGVNDMSYMFKECEFLTEIKFSKEWNTSNVTNMKSMFCGCSSIKQLPDISKWDTSKVTDMCGMFNGCSSLEKLPNDISKWDTSNVKDMTNMFKGCSSLTSLHDISNWDTSNVKDMRYMIEECNKLQTSFTYYGNKNIRTLSAILTGCSKLVIETSILDDRIRNLLKNKYNCDVTLNILEIKKNQQR